MSNPLYLIAGVLLNNVSMGATVTSAAQACEWQDVLSIAFKWTSSDAVGVFSVEVSNDYDPNAPSSANWNAFTFTPALAAPASNNGSFVADPVNTASTYFRVKYTRTSGTGTLFVTFSGKSL